MKILRMIALLGLTLVVAACSRTGGMTTARAPLMTPPPPLAAPVVPDFQPTPQSAPIQQARLSSADFRYIDATALPLLSPAARTAATDAQFYALQFGRPGAPRSWNAGGASGQVSVGPYVRVNNLDCREFSHRITVSGQTYTRSGTACREVDGTWDVVEA